MSIATEQQTDEGSVAKFKLNQKDRNVLFTTFGIDSRALAVVRILLATFLLIGSLFLELDRPRDPGNLGEFFGQYGDVIVIPFAVMMLLGWKTRLAVVLTWLAYSAKIRADLLVPGVEVSVGDYILTLTLFWGMFLPMGRHLSLDARKQGPRPPVLFLSLASTALLFQVVAIYFSAGMLKSMDEWVFDATAMRDILAHPDFETPLGTVMLGFPTVLAVMSVATIVLELVGTVLVILPGKTLPMRRMILVPIFIGLHIGIAAMMGLGLFPYICMAVWLLFLPNRFWDWLWRRFAKDSAPVEWLADTNKWRTAVVAIAVVIAVVSNAITWMYYPDPEGVWDTWQDVATYLVLYQQWAMFSVPSSL